MKKINSITFFLALALSLLIGSNANALEADRVGEPSDSGRLVGKGYLVIIFYADHITFDYYDFLEDGSFTIWTIEDYGEGEYSTRDELLFRAQFKGALSENVEFTYQIKGLILSEKLIFGEGGEYLGNSKGERYNFLGVMDTHADVDTTDQSFF